MTTQLFDVLSFPKLQFNQEKQLKPRPVYHEKYSSFKTFFPPEYILARVTGIIGTLPDIKKLVPKVQDNTLKFEIKTDHHFVSAKLNIFSWTDDSILCEFQRRFGDCIFFVNIYRYIMSQLNLPDNTEHDFRKSTSPILRICSPTSAREPKPKPKLSFNKISPLRRSQTAN